MGTALRNLVKGAIKLMGYEEMGRVALKENRFARMRPPMNALSGTSTMALTASQNELIRSTLFDMAGKD